MVEHVTTTLVGRVGSPSVRKSRTAPACAQKPQDIGSAGETAPAGSTGASQVGHASVPVASCHEVLVRRSS